VDGVPVLGAHHAENRARFSYPFPYDPAAPCDLWLTCLDSMFRDDADKADKINLIHEFGGACLIGIATTYQRALILQGGGNNGKSTCGLILSSCFPRGSICSVPPQLWDREYYRHRMMRALLNYVPELPESEIIRADSVKSMIDGSEGMTARAPSHAVVDFTPRMGQLWCANGMPPTADHTHAFWRRFMVLPFNRTYAEHEVIPDLHKVIIAECLPGIVAQFVAGAARLMARGRYVEPASSALAMAKWRRDADPIALFLEARTRPAVDYRERATCESVYQRFSAWCASNGHKAVSSTKFGTRMHGLGKGSERGTGGEYVYPVAFADRADEAFWIQKAGGEPLQGAGEDPGDDYDRSV
jgi:putative DNA primase/helicase